MRVTTLVSVKGAPGVTTLACLVAATWPDGRSVAVVEADPFGGDLAARFQLSTLRGWSSFMTAARRSEEPVAVGDHLQTLPGGLDVLVQPGANRQVVDRRSVEELLRSVDAGGGDGAPIGDRRDLVVDAGRLVARSAGPGDLADAGCWFDRSDVVVVVTRRDPPSLLNVRAQIPSLVDRWGDRVRLAVVGPGQHRGAAIEEFTGLPLAAEIPFDPSAARVITGEGGSRRHLSRSLLVASSRRLALSLVEPDAKLGERDGGGIPIVPRNDAVSAVSSVGGREGLARRLRRVASWGHLGPITTSSEVRSAEPTSSAETDPRSPRREVAR